MKIFKFIFLLLFIFASNTHAYNTSIEDCGLIDDPISLSGKAVSPEDYTICPQDISFKVFYVLFGDSLSDPRLDSVISSLVDIPESTKALSTVAGLGVPISAIYQALTSIVFTLGMVLILIQTGKYLHKAQSSGQFMGQNKGKAAVVAMEGLTALFLITPINNILVIQVLIFLMAIIGIMLANFFTGAFLSSVEVKSAKINLDENLLMSTSDSFSRGLVSQELCKSRTSKKILNSRLGINSEWVHESPDNVSLAWDGNDIGEFNEVANECLSYWGKADGKSNRVNQILFLKPELDDCDEQEDWDEIEYYPEDFGRSHMCGSIDYVWPQVETFINTQSTSNDKDSFKSVMGKIESNSFKDSWSPDIHFNSFVSQYKERISSIIFSNGNDTEKRNKLKKVYDDYSNELKNIVEFDEFLGDEISLTSNNQLKSNLIYIKHLAISNYMLGGFIQDGGTWDNFEINFEFSWPPASIESNFDKKHYLHDVNPKEYGVDAFKNRAEFASDELEQFHCAMNWDKLGESRKTLLHYNALSNGDDLEDFIENVNGDGKIDFECIQYYGATENKRFDNIFTDKGEAEESIKDFNTSGTFGLIIEKNQDEEEIKSLRDKFKREYALEHIKNSLVSMSLLSGYHYAVKKTLSNNLAETLKKSGDFSVMQKTRQLGWASLGSMMLSISKNMVSASQFVGSIMGTASVPVVGRIVDGGMEFSSTTVFSREETENIIETELTPMKVEKIFIGANITNVTKPEDLNNISEEEIDDIIGQVIIFFVDWIFEPMKYIKMGSNIDVNQNLVEGLKECAKSNDCISGQTHPINSMMMFGHETINTIGTVLMIKVASDMISDLISSDVKIGKKKGGIEDKTAPFKAVLKAFSGPIGWIVTVIGWIAQALSAFLSFISPVLFTMFFIGLLCGYFVPTMPYVFFTIVFMGWIISIFVTTIAAPIWVLLLANIKEDGSTDITIRRIWSITGSVLIKPPLITIAMIFAWTLSSVSLYFVNSTMFTILEATMVNAGIFTKIVSYSMSYVLYVILIYIVIQHSYQMISKFADEVSSLIEVKGTNDQSMIQSLQVERLLGASMATQTFAGPISSIAANGRDGRSAYKKTKDKASEMIKSKRGSRKD